MSDLIATWIELASAMTMRDIDAVPRASLGHGAAGFAYVLERLGGGRQASHRWLTIARRAAQRRDGFRLAERATGSSVMCGPTGLAAAAALVEPTSRHVEEYLVVARRRLASAEPEYLFGLAGKLLATIAIARTTGSSQALALVRDLAARLAPRRALPPKGFAHGDVGVTYALLAAAHALGDPIDPTLIASLAAIEPAQVLDRPFLPRSWCNGLAGYTLAWVLAAELTGDARCRAHALAAGPHLLEALDEANGTLCCGLGGRAYALLAIARIDPNGPWIAHAKQLATRAFAMPIANSGLLQGFPGLVLLAHDLQQPHAARFPLVEIA